jgi:hypothetical protein
MKRTTLGCMVHRVVNERYKEGVAVMHTSYEKRDDDLHSMVTTCTSLKIGFMASKTRVFPFKAAILENNQKFEVN